MTSRVTASAAALSAAAVVLGVGAIAHANPVNATFDRPTTDIWNYPFSTSFGTQDRTAGSTFAALGTPAFDERDAQVLTFWDSSAQVTPGQGVSNYEVLSATLTFTYTGTAPIEYDPTQDDFTTYTTAPDADAGRPLELFGTGFRNGQAAGNYITGTPGPSFSPPGPPSRNVRSAFAIDVSTGTERDVSNNTGSFIPDGPGFNPTPFAVGQSSLNPGDIITDGTVFTFDIDIADTDIEAYIAEGLNDGLLSFSLTSLHPAAFGGPPTFPAFILDVPGDDTVGAPTLELSVNVIPEPASLGLLGMAGLGLIRRRR
ncbi:MAG: PEP-CTERM sorting domain-containing protein [Planctomycetota bacterium]